MKKILLLGIITSFATRVYADQDEDYNYAHRYDGYNQLREQFNANSGSCREQCQNVGNCGSYFRGGARNFGIPCGCSSQYAETSYYYSNQNYDQNNYYGGYYSDDHAQENQPANNHNNDWAPISPSSEDQVQPHTSNDASLENTIHNNLKSGWFTRGFENVIIIVSQGNVTLRGTVDKPEDRAKIEESVRQVNGVRSVNNQITVNASNQAAAAIKATNNDKDLDNRIRDSLRNTDEGENLFIYVLNGNVTLRGTVDSPETKSNIESIVKAVSGVRNINNQIVVRSYSSSY